jgi:hypothetical protein
MREELLIFRLCVFAPLRETLLRLKFEIVFRR